MTDTSADAVDRLAWGLGLIGAAGLITAVGLAALLVWVVV